MSIPSQILPPRKVIHLLYLISFSWHSHVQSFIFDNYYLVFDISQGFEENKLTIVLYAPGVFLL